MVTFVMVPGALHGAWAWDRVAPMLVARGDRAIAPELPGMGGNDSIRAGDATLAIWTDFLVDQIRRAGEPVYLVGHSRGGLVIGEAAERVPELVRGLIYVTALIVPPGITTFEVMGPETTSHSLTTCEDGKAFLMQPDQARPIFYNYCTPEDADWGAARLCPEPLAIMSTPAGVSWERWGRLPRAFVECTEDRTLSLDQQARIQAPAPCDPVKRIKADHSPFLSAPEALVDALAEIVDGWCGRGG